MEGDLKRMHSKQSGTANLDKTGETWHLISESAVTSLRTPREPVVKRPR